MPMQHSTDPSSPRGARGVAPLALIAAALFAAGACGGGKLEGADTTGTIPNATGFDAPNSYDTAASPGGPDSSRGQFDPDPHRPPGASGDTTGVRPSDPPRP